MTANHGELLVWAGLVAASFMFAFDPALAQGNPFGVARPEPNLAPQDGLFSGVFVWIAARQAELYRTLSSLVTEFQTNRIAGLVLIAFSFAYGVLHAAGPGHGKAVISSYLVATGETARRGVILAFAAAFAQALTAIALVGVFTIALRATSVAMTEATAVIEIASYALVTGLGAWLVLSKAAAMLRPVPAGVGEQVHVQSAEGDGDDSGECCGHHHAPPPAMLEGHLSLKRASAAVAAVGLRPCTGAVLVLVFAFSQGVFLIGVASAFAMALGTGATVAVLAALAIGARSLAQRLAVGGSHRSLAALRSLELAAALAVLAFGLVLLGGAMAGAG